MAFGLRNILIFAVMLSSAPTVVFAQIPEGNSLLDTINKDDLGNVSDDFQDLFFQALTQKAIENYDRAAQLLEQSLAAGKDLPVIHYELGTNYKHLEDYEQAEKHLLLALKGRPDDRYIVQDLLTVYYENHAYEKGIELAKKWRATESDFTKNLAEFYFFNHDYIQALRTLDQWEETKGFSQESQSFRNKIVTEARDKSKVRDYLILKKTEQPENIQNYVDLILLYQDQRQEEKAFEVAKELKEREPGAVQAGIGLYPTYLINGKDDQAVTLMKEIIRAETISNDLKVKTINDFRKLVDKKPQFEGDLLEALGEEIAEGKRSNRQLAEHYQGKDDTKSMAYYERALAENPNDYSLIRQVLTLRITGKKYGEALDLAEKSLAIYPTQAVLYLFKGEVENKLGKYKDAEESLLSGIDFVIDDPEMRANFYLQLSETYKGMGKKEAADDYYKKATNLNKN